MKTTKPRVVRSLGYQTSDTSKYHNRRIQIDGESFDSQKEYNRYRELLLLQRAGNIRSLSRQVSFELVPPLDGQRAVTYKADFTYEEKSDDGTWSYVVEDVKGVRTEVYKIKCKLMYWLHGVKIREV